MGFLNLGDLYDDFLDWFPWTACAIEADSYLKFSVLAFADREAVVVSGMEEIPIEEEKESSLFANHHSQGCNSVSAGVAVSSDRFGWNEFTFGGVMLVYGVHLDFSMAFLVEAENGSVDDRRD